MAHSLLRLSGEFVMQASTVHICRCLKLTTGATDATLETPDEIVDVVLLVKCGKIVCRLCAPP